MPRSLNELKDSILQVIVQIDIYLLGQVEADFQIRSYQSINENRRHTKEEIFQTSLPSNGVAATM